MARRDRGIRLDQPYHQRRTLPRPSYEPDAFGRAVERIARFLGTGRFLVIQTLIILAWVAYNVFGPKAIRFDEYPFIFLTLALSLQASYAAPLILLAQNRQDDRDRANLSQDRDQNLRQQEDTEYLARELAAVRVALGEVVTRDFLRAELRAVLEELDNEAEQEKSERRRSREREARRRRKREEAGGVPK